MTASLLIAVAGCSEKPSAPPCAHSDSAFFGEDGAWGRSYHNGGHDIRQNAFFLQKTTAVFGFLDPLLGKRDVNPAGELIGLVPCALTVSEQYEFVCHNENFRRYPGLNKEYA